MKKTWMIHEYKQWLKHQDTKIYISSWSVEITTSFPKRRFELMVISISYISIYNIFRDVQNLYQDKASMDMTLNEFRNLTKTCWNENYQPLTIDTTKDK